MNAYKSKVAANLTAPYSTRFFHNFWVYRLGQLTTSNVRSMKQSSVGGPLAGAGGIGTKKEETEPTPVKSDLQLHGLHKFNGDSNHSLVVALKKNSEHVLNLKECKRGSLMVGHTNPQLFHWFKQLGSLPPRSIATGNFEVLTGPAATEAWEGAFAKHPLMHSLAQDLWEKDETKTAKEKAFIERREREELEKRMKRLSSPDWRGKFLDRERNPKAEEDEERPIYVVKPDSFVLVKLNPDLQLWASYSNRMQRVYQVGFAESDPLARACPRFLKMFNASREKLIPALNLNYSLKLTNAFIFDVDKTGLWGMGTQEQISGDDGRVKEEWAEYRFDFGKDQELKTVMDVEWWIHAFFRYSMSEAPGKKNETMESSTDPELEYRQL